jgi:hypothetical protein
MNISPPCFFVEVTKDTFDLAMLSLQSVTRDAFANGEVWKTKGLYNKMETVGYVVLDLQYYISPKFIK